MTDSGRLHVVLGTGPLGLAIARRLAAEGCRVRAVNRSGSARLPPEVKMIAADAADVAALRASLRGASVVYHCLNTPYHTWPATLPPLMTAVIAAASSTGARLVYGDNLYAYGPVQAALTEDLPYRPHGPNARTRAELATEVLHAHATGVVEATIGRASDFFGPDVRVSQMGERVFGHALAGKPASVLGNPDLPHTYTFIDDFAAGLITLGEREEALGETWHVPNSETVTTREFVTRIFVELGAEPRLRVMPRALLALLAAVNPTLRAVRQVAYQLEQPFVVDHAKFARVFDTSPTPRDEAIRRTVAWYREQSAPTGEPRAGGADAG